MNSHESRLVRPGRGTMVGLAILSTICFAPSSSFADTSVVTPVSFADPFPITTVLSQYGFVSVGSSASIKVNTGPNATNALVGDGSTVSASGGNNGSIDLGVDVSPPVSGCGASNLQCFSGLQNSPMNFLVDASVGVNAFNEAAALSAFLATLTPDETFASVPNGTIVGNGGLNVINITGNSGNPAVEFQGDENDFFVINMFGNLSENKAMSLIGTVDPAHIIWNFLAGSGNVVSTSGGGVAYGTFLDVQSGANFQMDNVTLTGGVWNTGGHIEWVSGSKLTGDPFVGLQHVIPEPDTLAMALMGIGMTGLAGLLRRKVGARR